MPLQISRGLAPGQVGHPKPLQPQVPVVRANESSCCLVALISKISSCIQAVLNFLTCGCFSSASNQVRAAPKVTPPSPKEKPLPRPPAQQPSASPPLDASRVQKEEHTPQPPSSPQPTSFSSWPVTLPRVRVVDSTKNDEENIDSIQRATSGCDPLLTLLYSQYQLLFLNPDQAARIAPRLEKVNQDKFNCSAGVATTPLQIALLPIDEITEQMAAEMTKNIPELNRERARSLKQGELLDALHTYHWDLRVQSIPEYLAQCQTKIVEALIRA